ncbi:MAG: hypothetical protein ABIQ40_02045 [Bacteroidia bacterium]
MPTSESYISFLPFLRQGLAGALTIEDTITGSEPSGVEERGFIKLKYDVKATPVSGSDELLPKEREVFLTGPGDIIGVSSQAIVRVCPKDWETNFESNYFPFVEFYDEDFLWRYTPAAAAPTSGHTGDPNFDRLRPWMTLIALEETEFSFDSALTVLPSISLLFDPTVCLPHEQQTWAWAHVHVNKDLDSTQINVEEMLVELQGTLTSNPDMAVSRLMCGRRLKPNTSYHLFLIPTFEVGRLAGLGKAIPANADALAPAWKWTVPFSMATTPDPTKFPYYQKWYFKTGAAGDFESLSRALKPGAIPETVGKRLMDIQMPGESSLELQSPVPTLGLEGAVKPVGFISDTWTIPDGANNFIQNLRPILNAPDELITVTPNADPLIAPPLYGRWHAERTKLNTTDSDWLHTVNLDPRYRTFAGLGAEVIRDNQEEFMTLAWKQVGDVIEANRLLAGLQLAQETSENLFKRHFRNQPDELVFTLTGNAHARIIVPASLPVSTVYNLVRTSLIPTEMFSAAFRRLTSPRGQFPRLANASGAQPFADYSLLANFNNFTIAAAPDYVTPVGQLSLTVLTPAQLTVSYTQSQPARANFSLTSPNNAALSVTATGSDSIQAAAFRTAAVAFHAYVSTIQPGPTVLPAFDASNTVSVLTSSLEPVIVYNALASQVTLTTPDGLLSAQTTADIIMAAPVIRRAMYKYLLKQSPDWMVPGLNDLSQNSVSIFEMNQPVIEAFMLGLNHEFGRELLWRGYPTDQRGTYFSHFWDFADSTPHATAPNDYSALADIKPIHQWKVGNNFSNLGTNSGRIVSPENLLIVALRGDLLKKYPNTFVGMNRAKWALNEVTLLNDYSAARDLDTSAGSYKTPLFTAKVNPDILFFGFDVSANEAKGVSNDPNEPGWFFMLQERAGEVRFGLDVIEFPLDDLDFWDDLQWGHFTTLESYPYLNTTFNQVTIPSANNPEDIKWGKNSADIAYITMQKPVKLALHAKDLLQ